MQSLVSGNKHWSQAFERGVHHTLGHTNTSSVTCVLAMQTYVQTAHETCLSLLHAISVHDTWQTSALNMRKTRGTPELWPCCFCRGGVRSPHHLVVIMPFCSNAQFLRFTRQSLLKKKNVAYFVTFSIICIGILLSHRKAQRHCLDK